jgi:hypothetical protein
MNSPPNPFDPSVFDALDDICKKRHQNAQASVAALKHKDKRIGPAMLQIKVNDAITSLFARLRPDGGWDLRCMDPLVGEFRLRSGDILHFWSEGAREWLPASEMDLTELAVREAERKGS